MTAEHLPTPEERLPKEHGAGGQTHEVIDLGGPVARVTRQTFVYSQWTKIVFMVPAYPDAGLPAGSIELSFDAKTLNQLLERLAWPTGK